MRTENPTLTRTEDRVAHETLRCDCHGQWNIHLRVARGVFHATIPPQAAFSPVATTTLDSSDFYTLCTRIIRQHDALHLTPEPAARTQQEAA